MTGRLPLNRSSTWIAVTMLAIWLVVLTGLVVFQVRWILRSRFPGLRGVEALATSIPLFLLWTGVAAQPVTRQPPQDDNDCRRPSFSMSWDTASIRAR